MSSEIRRFRCFLIGSESLLAECAETLLKQGHEILGVITSARKLSAWAHGRNLRVLDPRGDYRAALAEQPFEHLFSITHLAVIPADVIALPTKGAVNFHDGPLPRYAGLNTPVWALLNRETDYAITWHWMTAGIDDGDVLIRQPVEIAADDTALSLNTKCFQAGIESFAELAGWLGLGTPVARPQNLEGRRYFGKHDRPEGAGLLDWSRSADELQTLVRALDHGRYRNPVATAKVRLAGKLYVVDAAQVVKSGDAQTLPAGEPGTIVDGSDAEIRVATGLSLIHI